MNKSNSYARAKERALSHLGRRAYTAYEIKTKLEPYFEDEVINMAIERMIELGLINDLDYARRRTSDYINLKGYALSRIKQELIRRGIDDFIIQEVFEELDYTPYEHIESIIQKKYMSCFDKEADEKRRNKAVNALLRMGYKYEDIRNTVREMNNQ